MTQAGGRRMRLGMLVNDVATERPGYTTTRLALTATGRGHEVWFMGAGDLAYDPDDTIRARARAAIRRRPSRGRRSPASTSAWRSARANWLIASPS